MTIGPVSFGGDSEMHGLADGAPEQSEVARRAQELDELRSDNARRVAALQAQGAMIDPMAIFQARLHAVTEALLPEGTEERLALELSFERTCVEILDQAEREVRSARLSQGVPQAPNNGHGPRPGGGLVLPPGM